MSAILQRRVLGFFDQGATSATTTEQGRAIESLVCYLFECIPGIEVVGRNAVNVFATEEVDVALWNDQHDRGLRFLPNILLVECKNWSRPVDGREVASFVRTLQNRSLDIGFLIATRGITGVPAELTGAHYEIATALKDGIRIIVIDRAEIEALAHSDDLVRLVKRKLGMLAIRGTCF